MGSDVIACFFLHDTTAAFYDISMSKVRQLALITQESRAAASVRL